MDLQIERVRNLETPPDIRYEMVTYQVDQWPGNNLFVKRSYRPMELNYVVYHENIVVGPRGGMTIIHKWIES